MKVKYVLMYGTPYLKFKPFKSFHDISVFLLRNKIIDYTIYEHMDDLTEHEMILLESDVNVLEDRINKALEYIDIQFDNNGTISKELKEILKGSDK